MRRGGSAHRRISRKFQQQRGHFDMVWNLATNAVLIFIDWHVHLSGLEVVVEAQDIPAWLRLKSGTVEFKSTSMI